MGESLRCSFCGKKQEVVGKLISNPSSQPRVYICDECVATCAAIIEDDRLDAEAEIHPLLNHPLATELMACVVRWIRQESSGADASEELARLRAVAEQIVRET